MRSLIDPENILRNVGIAKGMAVADLGCGQGFFTIPIASIVGTEGKVYAVDSDPVALDYLREGMKGNNVGENVIEIMQTNMSSTGIPDHSIDAIFLANVFHDIEDRAAFFGEAKRICKPGGMLIDVDWEKVNTARGPPFKLRIPVEEAKEILSGNGFKVVKSIEAGQNHYGFVCRLVSK